MDFHEKQAMKLSKYIFSDHSMISHQVTHNQKAQIPIMKISLIITIIKASISKFTECINSPSVITQWKFLLEKSKRFIRELE